MYNSLPLSVGGTCDSLLVYRIWLRRWDVTPKVTLHHTRQSQQTSMRETLLLALKDKQPCFEMSIERDAQQGTVGATGAWTAFSQQPVSSQALSYAAARK